MSHGVYHLEPDVANLSQLAVVVMPAKSNLVGGMMPGAGLGVDVNGVVNLQPATAAALGGVKIGANVTVQPDGTISVGGAWQNYMPTLTVVSGAPSNVSFQLAQWVKNGPTVDVIIAFSLTFTLKPSELHLSLPIAMAGSSGWPAHAIGGLIGAATACWAYLDPSLGIIVTAGASGTFANGSSQFQVDARYRIA
jgi:hypothetical protein